MKVFIVRPFGKRTIYKKEKGHKNPVPVAYDFDLVETLLIKEAMSALQLTGGTTGEVFESGEVREDMFSELLLADIVVADISVYNPNVFYELGIRHALRDRITILIKSKGFDDTPFDIMGYKYVSYEKDDPAKALPELVRFIGDSMVSGRKDSPVFNILPKLESQDPEKYLALPADFTLEVILATQTRSVGKLALLAGEVGSFSWKYPALRQIGESLFQLKANKLAKNIWEEILQVKPGDIEANDRLATIYQRLAEEEIAGNPVEGLGLFTRSDLAIGALIDDTTISNYQRAEAFALRARNAKSRWVNTWKGLPAGQQGAEALQSSFLKQAYDNYSTGFCEDQNHFYSGLNALGLLITIIHLAEAWPEIWELDFDTPDKAAQQLLDHKATAEKLSIAVCTSIDAAKYRLEVKGKTDNWVNISEADYICLTNQQPLKVASKYKQAIEAATGLNSEAISRQLELYEALGVKSENIQAALNVVGRSRPQQQQQVHYLLFTGHMIDKPGRAKPRFPAAQEGLARQWIKDKVLEIQEKMAPGNILTGIAGGACGGDILFHEICRELSIPSGVYLALPREQFLVESVAFAGNAWIDRFDDLLRNLPHPVLSETKELPHWLRKKPDYDIWVRNNRWLLNSALANGGVNMTLITLWNGEGGDGPGGTENMVRAAAQMGAKNYIIDSNKLVI